MTATDAAKALRIQGVNGIADLRLDLSQHGVLVARGPNGAGKTSTISAVRSALGDGTATCAPTDGTPTGTVTGCGVTLKVGRQRRVTGEPTIELADTGALHRLIDPGFKDPTVNARERIRALLEMVPLPATSEVVLGLCDGDESLAASVPHVGDLLVIAEGVRLRAMERAREFEQRCAEAKGAAQHIRERLPLVSVVCPKTPEQARKDLDGATRAAERIRGAVSANQKLAEQKEQARAAMGEKPDVDASQRKLTFATENLEAARAALTKATAEHATATATHNATVAAFRAWEKHRDVLSKPLEGATQADLDAAEATVAEAQQLVELADSAKADASARVELERRTVEAEKADDFAGFFRGVVTGLQDKLAEALRGAGLDGLTVVNGRLAVVDEQGRTQDFESRLSFGQRVRVALRAALLRKTEAAAVLPLDPAFWAALDPMRKQEIHDAAIEVGVTILTEEPTDGSLRVEALK